MLFADIRGFTRLIESTPAPVAIRLLDEYFSEMIDMIFARQGTVEQLIGDEIVALFGRHRGRARRRRAGVFARASTWSTACGPWPSAGPPTGLPAFDIGIGISSGA